MKQLHQAFRRIKSFACVEVKPRLNLVPLYLKIGPEGLPLAPGFIREVRNLGRSALAIWSLSSNLMLISNA
ncbi:hypothetical protein D9M70_513160 [compost metagenome]